MRIHHASFGRSLLNPTLSGDAAVGTEGVSTVPDGAQSMVAPAPPLDRVSDLATLLSILSSLFLIVRK